MSEYPECEKLAATAEHSQPIGEFLEWLGSQGIQLMTWRTDMTDTRLVDPECQKRISDRQKARDARLEPPAPLSCDHNRLTTGLGGAIVWWQAHCQHWTNSKYPAVESAGQKQGICCHCGRGTTREITITSGTWVQEQRSTEQLLADYFSIDLNKVEAERRELLKSLRDQDG